VIAAGTPQDAETEPERLVIARVDAASTEVSANTSPKFKAYHVAKDSTTGLYTATAAKATWYRYRDSTADFGAGAGWGPITSRVYDLELNTLTEVT
jgi:hypothetical protein